MKNIIKISVSLFIVSLFFSGCLLKDSVNTPDTLRGLKQGEFLKFAFEMKLNEAELEEYKFQEEFKAEKVQRQAINDIFKAAQEDYFLNKAPKDDEKMEQFKLEYQRDTGKVWQGF